MERPDLLQLADRKIVVLDGAMGTNIHTSNVTQDDYQELEGCSEILLRTRPEVIQGIHASFLEAGCDVVETNTFGANGVVFREYGLEDQVYEFNRLGASLAREVARDLSTSDRPRYVLGSVGPGTRVPSLGHISFDDLKAAFVPQFQGLLDGGADAVCIETCQDLLQVKAALDAANSVFRGAGRRLPVFVSVTIESSGTMLVGSDIQTALAVLRPLGVDVVGMNCATGPGEMKRHVVQLSSLGPDRIFAMPNAGLPRNDNGKLVYPMDPESFADWIEGFVREDGVGIVGGCCGTTPAHLAAVVKRLEGAAPGPRRRQKVQEVASLFQAVSMRQEPAPLLVGESTNANGSKEFRERLLADDIDGMVSVGQEQERGGAHLLDVCVAYVGRDEARDMERLVPEMARSMRLPLMLDSTSPDALEKALKLHGGRCTVNSVNLEDGRGRLDQVAGLARRFGAALVALAIDEEGMATTAERKLEVAERILEICTGDHGFAPGDLVFDMLTFTVASGDEDSRTAARETLEAIREFKSRHPQVNTILGVSNVSFGLKPSARRVLNSVFLAEAVSAGLDQAIVNARGILPLYRIDADLKEAALRLLGNDWSQGDPLAAYMALFEDGKNSLSEVKTGEEVVLSKEDRLSGMVVDGTRKGLEVLLGSLMADGWKPVEIINQLLIKGMQRVGELFGSGQMQLPFVLKSAEVMKAAVGYLESFMDKADLKEQGVFVIATVKGDVHDIGKNLVDIIVSNNGYKVVNLGIKVSLEQMLDAVKTHNAMALGMSGLLVKSTLVMQENLAEMKRRGVQVPVLLGGAALNRPFVEEHLRGVYGPEVYYAEDAFEGLSILGALAGRSSVSSSASSESDPLNRPRSESARTLDLQTPRPSAKPMVQLNVESGEELPAPQIDRSVLIPNPPFLGTRIISDIPLDEVFELLNENTLFRGQWRYRRGSMEQATYEAMIRDKVRPVLAQLKTRAREEGFLRPQGIMGYFKCFSRGRSLVIPGFEGRDEVVFDFPRKQSGAHNCIADYFTPEGGEDVVGLFVVTVGSLVSEQINKLFQESDYQDYLHLHGFAVEAAEATAEWMHRLMREQMGIAGGDSLEGQGMVRQGYRGSRYSFGYPACPNLEDQAGLFSLLSPGRIGVSLTEGWQMAPEQSVSALVVHHPEAKYFNLD